MQVADDSLTEILFYHLTEKRMEQVLPGLLEKCLERDWRVTVQTGEGGSVEALDAALWTYEDQSFLPHSAIKDGHEAHQPIWLTADNENPNQSNIRFLVEGAVPETSEGYERIIYLFDGHNADQLAIARERWKIEKAAGHQVTYWQQSPQGRWEKKA